MHQVLQKLKEWKLTCVRGRHTVSKGAERSGGIYGEWVLALENKVDRRSLHRARVALRARGRVRLVSEGRSSGPESKRAAQL